MSDAKKITLNDVEWLRVRMLAVQGTTIHIVTDEGPLLFEFASEQEAKNALDQCFVRQGRRS